jgi:hypothetical protein
MVMDQGKTNQFGKREYVACIRNKEVVAYPVGADVKCLSSDFQAKRAVGGRKERFVEGHFNPDSRTQDFFSSSSSYGRQPKVLLL